MLVLSRKEGETIFIGEDIRIVLLTLHGKQARIGISCPDYLTVMRAELGKRTRKNRWPNCSPEEITYLHHRYDELREWWELTKMVDREREFNDIDAFLIQLRRWALIEYMERYSHWYKEA
jgi:carbon storage regulator